MTAEELAELCRQLVDFSWPRTGTQNDRRWLLEIRDRLNAPLGKPTPPAKAD